MSAQHPSLPPSTSVDRHVDSIPATQNTTEYNGDVAIAPLRTNSEPSLQGDSIKALSILLRERKFIGYTTLGCALIAAVISFAFLPNWYTSTANLVPPKRSSNMLDGIMGGLSSTLKDIGLSKMGGSKGSDSYTHYVILQESRRLKDTIIMLFNLAQAYDIDPKKATDLRDEFDNNVKINVGTEGNYLVSASHTDPKIAADMANKIVEIGNHFANQIFQLESSENRRITEQRYNQNEATLIKARDTLKNFSLRYKIFSPPDQAKAASTSLAEVRAERIRQEMALDVLKNTYGASDPATQLQRKQLENFRAKESEIENQPGFIGNFSIAQGSEVMMEYMRLYTDVEVYSKVKAFMVPMLEQAKLDEQRVMPAMYVLDPAVPADKKTKPKRSLIIGGALLGGFILSCLIVLLRQRVLRLRSQIQMLIVQADATPTEQAITPHKSERE